MRKASEAVRLQRLFPYLRNSIASVKVTASLPIAALPPFPKPGAFFVISHPNATSRAIIRLNPTPKDTVPTLECSP